MSTTPNMNLSLPSPSSTPGPGWATNVNTAFSSVDSHDHTPGKGTLIPAAGLNITTDLSLNNAKLTQVGAVNLSVQDSALPAANAQSVYSISGDLWYNNSSGTPVQITAGNSITSASSPLVPPGVIWPYGGTSAPTGFLLCDGSEVSQSTYSTLFAAIGTAYNTGGEGAGNFRLPNLMGRAPIGAGTYTDSVSGSITRALGSYLGAEAHVLTQNQLAAHTHAGIAHSHGITDPSHTHHIYGGTSTGVDTQITADAGAPVGFGGSNTQAATTGISVNSATASVQSTGTNTAHNNMQPSVVTNFIIKT